MYLVIASFDGYTGIGFANSNSHKDLNTAYDTATNNLCSSLSEYAVSDIVIDYRLFEVKDLL